MMEPGTVVMVFSPITCEGVDPIGMGRYCGEERIDVEDNDSHIIFSFDTPRLVLDDGEIIYGFECWWCPA